MKDYEKGIEYLINNGVVNIDKPSGPTSHQVSAWVKKILNLPKAAHGGTLDPRVTGVLPVALNNAVRAIGAMHSADKKYICHMKLHSDVKKEKVREIFEEFTGEIYQIPPIKSAVKRRLRKRRIYDLKIIEMDRRDVLFEVHCDPGTYMRIFCRDVGEVIGCGAHMQSLRRIKSGVFDEKTLCTLQDLLDAYTFCKEDNDESELRRIILPMKMMLMHLPIVYVKDTAVDAICHGSPLAAPGIKRIKGEFGVGDTVALFTLKDEVIGWGKSHVTHITAISMSEGIVVMPKRVLMKPGTYTPYWKGLKKMMMNSNSKQNHSSFYF